MTLPTFYTTEEVAEALRVTPTAVRRMVGDGVVNPMRLSKGDRSPMRWTEADVEKLRRALTPAAPPQPAPRRGRRRRRTEVA